MSKKTAAGQKVISVNKKARHLYEFIDKYEAGVSLTGSEVKSLVDGQVAFKDGYVKFQNGEAWLVGVHIAPYENAGQDQHDPERPRRLLLHKYEIANMVAKVEQKGLTVVPTKVYFSNGKIKVEIAVSRGKKVYDRRDELKRRDIERDTKRQLRDY
jgi:SsrA-binding protein